MEMKVNTASPQASAADPKSLTYSRRNPVQGLQIESGTRIIELLVPITFRSPPRGIAAVLGGLRKVGTSRRSGARCFKRLRVDQHARVEHALRIELALGGAKRGGEQLRPLAVVPRPVVAADGMMMGDGAAGL